MIRRMTFILVSLFLIFFLEKVTYAKNNETTVNYDQLLPIAKKYLGTPYSWGGTTPAGGFDCSGYITYVYNQLNINLPRNSKEMAKAGEFVKRSDLRIGDLVFFNTFGNGISHAGIYIGNNEFIHASDSKKGVMISSLNDPYYWKSRYLAAARVLNFSLDVGSFQDVKASHWAYEPVQKLSQQGILIGYEKSFFKPEDKITRAEVVSMLAEALKLDISDRTVNFKDVPATYWAVGAINALHKQGIIKGDSLGNFNPEGVLKREHVAIIFNNAFDLEKRSRVSSFGISSFSDVSATSPSFEAIQKLAASGITTGYSDNTFRPREDVKRAQYVAFLYRALY